MNLVERLTQQIMVLAIMNVAAEAAVIRVNLDINRGQPERLPVSYSVSRAEMAAGGDRLLGVEIETGHLVMTPLQEGRTTVYLYDREEIERDRLEVFITRGGSQESLDVVVRAFLSDEQGLALTNLSVQAVGGSEKVRLCGSISSILELERVTHIRSAFGDAVIDLTRLSPAFGSLVVDETRKRIGNGNVEISFSGQELFLQGLTFSETEKSFIESAARSIYPNVRSFITVKPWKGSELPQDVVLEKPLLLLECQLLEITVDTMREMGVNWGGVQNLSVQAGWKAASGSGVTSISLATDKLFQLLTPHLQSGQARLLYTQNLVCEDGGKGRFFAGGSFHIVAVGPGNQDVAVEEVEYGIGLDVEPRLDRHGNMETKVAIEFSNLGPVIAAYPSILKRYVRTSVNVKQGQTLSLGALIGHASSEDVSKVPGLGSIPVLGELFKSERYQKKQSELVILITPRRIVPGGPEETALRDGMLEKMEKAERSAHK